MSKNKYQTSYKCNHSFILDNDASPRCEKCGSYNLDTTESNEIAYQNEINYDYSDEEYSFPDKNDERWSSQQSFEE